MEAYVVHESGNRMSDLYRLDERYERELKTLDKVQFFSQSDRELFIQFLHSMQACGISYSQLTKYILAMKTFLESYRKPFNQLDRMDLEDFLLHMKLLKPATRQTRWYCLKKFFEYINLGNKFFPIRFKIKNKLPEEILTEEEMDELIENATSLRNRTFLSTLCEGGYRIGEILTAKVKDVLFIEYGAKIMVNGKTGMRCPLLIRSVALLKEYLMGLNPIRFIFPISYPNARKILSTSLRRANINKRIHLHSLRHSAATRDANHLTESQLCAKYGWTIGSRMCRIYVQLSGRGLDEAILKMHGIEPQASEEFEKLKRSGIG